MSILLQSSVILTPDLAVDDVQKVGIFPRGHVTIVAGSPGCGKTWFMLDVCKSVASGDFGMGVYTERYPVGRCLVFAGETGVRLLANRVKLLGGFNPPESVRVVSSHKCALLDIDTMVNTAIGRRNILEAMQEFKPDIAFFDTMISFMSDGKDESSQVDIADCIRGIGAIAASCNVAVVVMHHFRKRSNQGGDVQLRSMDDVIGSSAFTRLASLVVGIERKGDIRIVRCLKSWWEEFPPFSFRVIGKNADEVLVAKNYGFDDPLGNSRASFQTEIMKTIKAKFPDEAFSVADICAEVDCSRPTASTMISVYCSRGVIECVGTPNGGNTKYYRFKKE